MQLANINYFFLLFVIRSLVVGVSWTYIFYNFNARKLFDNPNIFTIVLATLIILAFIYSLYRAYNKKSLLPQNYQESGKITVGLFFTFLGHISAASIFYVISLMEPGKASGLFLLPSLIFSAIFYIVGANLVFYGIKKLTNENT